MQHIATALVVAALVAPVAAQNLRSRLVANAPIVLAVSTPTGITTLTKPAGGMAPSGSLAMPWSFVSWTSTGTSWQFANSMMAAYPVPSQALLDCTLSLAGTPSFGHLHITMRSDGDVPGNPTVDVFDDGVIDAMLPPQNWGATTDLHVPLRMSATPTKVRVRLVASVPAPIGHWIEVRWEPWTSAAKDIGSSCPSNRFYWNPPGATLGLDDYFLAALPGTAGNALDLVADGRGTLATFVVSMAPQRLAPGTLGFGSGCDDLLLAPIFDTPGASIGAGRWRLSVPTLPPGLTFYVQHVSVGLGSGFFGYLGATNLVSYRT